MHVIFSIATFALLVGIVLLFIKKIRKRIALSIIVVSLVAMFSTVPEESLETSSEQSPNKVEEVSKPAKEETIDEKISSTVVDELGKKTNMKKDRVHKIEVYDDVVNVWINSDDNLTASLAKKGMWRDTFDALEKLADFEEVSLYQIVWMTTFTNKYGEETEGKIMTLDFPREIIDKINFDKVDYNNAPDIAENYWEHNALK